MRIALNKPSALLISDSLGIRRLASLGTRENLSAGSFALAIACVLTGPQLLSTLFFYYLIFLTVGYYLACPIEWRWDKTSILCAVIAVSSIIAIPISIFVDGHAPLATAFNCGLTLLLFPLLFIKHSYKIFLALIPIWIIHPVIMSVQWVAHITSRPFGLTAQANAASTFLLLGAIFIAHHPRYKWWCIPLLTATLFSGSRWTVIVAAICFGGMFLRGHLKGKWLASAIVLTMAAIIIVQQDGIKTAFRIDPTWHETTDRNASDVRWRFTPAEALLTPWNLLPLGFIDSQLHNVPLRMVTETGLLSGLAWVLVSAMALYRQPRRGYRWWMLLAVCLLSMMYYATWIGPMGAFWWLLVSQSKESAKLEA